MANGNEIDKPRSSPSDLFLRDVQVPSKAGEKLYDLQTEYEKTRKNKAIWLWLAVSGFVIATVAAAVAVTFYLENRARESEVDIADFQTLELRELLDNVASQEQELESAREELETLREDLELRIQRVQDRRDQQIEVARAEYEDDQQALEERIAEIRQQAQQDIQAIRSELEPQIRAQEETVQSLQQQMAQYDEDVVEQVQEQEQQFNNELRLARLRMQERVNELQSRMENMRQEYEARIADLRQSQEELESALNENRQDAVSELRARFNPTFESGPAARVLQELQQQQEAEQEAGQEGQPEDGQEQEGGGQADGDGGADGQEGDQAADDAQGDQAEQTDDGGAQDGDGGSQQGAEQQQVDFAERDPVQALRQSAALSEEQASRLSGRIDSAGILLRRLQEIPYENSVPPALAGIERLVTATVSEMASIHDDRVSQLQNEVSMQQEQISQQESRMNELQNEIGQLQNRIGEINTQLENANAEIEQLNEQQSRLQSFRYAVMSFLKQSRENGYIIDARDPNNVMVLLQEMRLVNDGTLAYVFREDDQYIGRIELSVGPGNTVRGKMIETVNDATPRPFDMVLMELTTRARESAVNGGSSGGSGQEGSDAE